MEVNAIIAKTSMKSALAVQAKKLALLVMTISFPTQTGEVVLRNDQR